MTDNNTALKKAGLKVTLPRLKILEVLQGPDNHHVSAEDLYKRLIDMGEEIGLATVYRVLNQFDDAGIVTRHNFEGGKSVFELTQQHHHDHRPLEPAEVSDGTLRFLCLAVALLSP
ncbi:ferric iron uptake transcriptional regulator, partial [Enterobacter hormaechei]|nr:ferric iron uptake transcriptional regulator [Enterobacter hormaechei]